MVQLLAEPFPYLAIKLSTPVVHSLEMTLLKSLVAQVADSNLHQDIFTLNSI